MRTIVFKNEINFETIDELIREIEITDQFENPTKIKYFNEKKKNVKLICLLENFILVQMEE